MDTRWKKLNSRWVKILLIALYVIFMGAAGASLWYVPANSGYNSSLIKTIYTRTYEEQMNEAYSDYVNCIKANLTSCIQDISAAENRDMGYIASKKETAYNLTMQEYLDNFVKNDVTFYVRIKTASGAVYENDYDYGDWISFDHLLGWDRDINDRDSYGIDLKQCNWLESIKIGMTGSEYSDIAEKYTRKPDIELSFTISAIAAVLGIVVMVLICIVVGKNTDAEKKLGRFFSVYYEITAVIAVLTGIAAYVVPDDYVYSRFHSSSFNPRPQLIMAIAGLLTAALCALILYLVVCVIKRAKCRCLLKGSLIVVVCIKLYKFLKDLLTGQIVKRKVTKKLLLMDVSFLLTTVLNILVWNFDTYFSFNSFGTSYMQIESRSVIGVLAVEILLLGLFIWGRYCVLKDLADVEKQVEEICAGNEDYTPVLSKNSSFADMSGSLKTIGENYRKSHDEQIKAERMKVELITNVSHDLKTPLTSIISYVNLLSKEELTPQAKEYVDILQQKSDRLQGIVSDVFDLAKATSGNIAMDNEQLDLSKLSEQIFAEFEDRIAEGNFDVRKKICQPPVTVYGDGKKMYRIIQNLLDNAMKYSLKGTRIYYTLEKQNGKAVISISNTSSYEMNFTADEITERFTRGDKARTTDGSGLGLSIAKGFAAACGGDMRVEIDGDMFKAIVDFPLMESI